MDNQATPSVFKQVLEWVQSHGGLIALIGVLSGVAVGIGIPVWQNYWVEQSELSVEINGINRTISPEAGFPAEDELLTVIMRSQSVSGRYRLTFEDLIIPISPSGEKVVRRKREGLSPEAVQAALEGAKQELKDLPGRIDARKQDKARVDALTPDTITYTDVVRLNRPLSSEVDVDRTIFSSNADNRTNNQDYFRRIISDFATAYSKRLADTETRYTELQTQLPAIERRIESLNEELLKKKSYFTISAALNNSGRSSTSIKRPGLFAII